MAATCIVGAGDGAWASHTATAAATHAANAVAAIAIRRAQPEWLRNAAISATRRGSDAGPDIRERIPSNRSGGGVTPGICSLSGARRALPASIAAASGASELRRASTAARSSASSEPARTRPPVRRCRLPRSLTKTILELRKASAEPRLDGRNRPAEAVGDLFARHAVVVGQRARARLPFRLQAVEAGVQSPSSSLALMVGRRDRHCSDAAEPPGDPRSTPPSCAWPRPRRGCARSLPAT